MLNIEINTSGITDQPITVEELAKSEYLTPDECVTCNREVHSIGIVVPEGYRHARRESDDNIWVMIENTLHDTLLVNCFLPQEEVNSSLVNVLNQYWSDKQPSPCYLHVLRCGNLYSVVASEDKLDLIKDEQETKE